MSRRQRQRGVNGIRGPNSALTEFLRNEGITDAFRQRRLRDLNGANQDDHAPTEDNTTTGTETPEPTTTDDNLGNVTPEVRTESGLIQGDDEDEDDEEIRQMKRAAKRKLKAARRGGRRLRSQGSPDGNSSSSDSDSDANFSDDDDDDEDEDDLNNEIKKFGEDDECVDCGKTFELSVSSRFIKEQAGYLCHECNQLLKAKERKLRANQLNARKRRKKVAQALLNKSEIKVPKLQDVCIKKITENIEEVDVLGDIGQVNMNRISKILSKNRSLNNKTMTLFLTPDLKRLEFWDCSNVDSDSLNKIASFCPNLESLTLFMCGQLHNDNLQYFATNLTKLHDLALNGPFLISDVMWQDYFEEAGSRLTKFEIRNTHRFGNDSLISLLENTGKNLTSLKLSRLDGLNSSEIYGLIPHYILDSKLTDLEISYPQDEELISDDLIITILSITGDTLTLLNLDGCSSLTERFLLEGVVKFCPNLTHLSIQHLDQITNEGFAKAFKEYGQINQGGLIEVYLTKCIGLGDEAVYELFQHSSHTLVELSINSLHLITNDFLHQVFTEDLHQFKKKLRELEENNSRKYYKHIGFPLLTYFDVGFVRAVDNEVLELIGESCPQLKVIEVYGDNRCTSRARFRNGLMVIGRQSDEIS